MKTWKYYCLACFWVMLTMAHGYQFSVWQSPELPKGQIEQDGKSAVGIGASTDILEASALALLNAINRLVINKAAKRLKAQG